MTCAQGLLRLLWRDPKLECYGTVTIGDKIVSFSDIFVVVLCHLGCLGNRKCLQRR